MQRPLNTFSKDKGLVGCVSYLWMQDEVRFKRSRVRTVKSDENVADLGTKPLSKAVIAKHSITLECVDMTEEKVQDVQQAPPTVLIEKSRAWRYFGTSVQSKTRRKQRKQVQGFETGDRTASLQSSVGDHAQNQKQNQQRQRRQQ